MWKYEQKKKQPKTKNKNMRNKKELLKKKWNN